MVTKMPRRTSFSGPALVRLLSRLGQVEVTEPRQSPAARLDEWLGWTESIVLSTVLNAAAADAAGRAGAGADKASDAGPRQAGSGDAKAVKGLAAGTTDNPGDDTNDVIDDMEFAAAEYAKVRDALEQAISAALSPPVPASAQQRRQYLGAPKSLVDVDFPSYRRRYSMLQQKMETSIAALRGRVRALLSARGPEMAQLAAVDGAMEQAMVEHELRLLAGIPNLLEQRFRQLAQEGLMKAAAAETERASASASDAPMAATVTALQAQLRRAAKKPDLEPGPWLDTFRDDMRGVLTAELDLRLQPIEGLLCALRGQ